MEDLIFSLFTILKFIFTLICYKKGSSILLGTGGDESGSSVMMIESTGMLEKQN